MIKKIFLVLFVLFFLNSCFFKASDNTEKTETNKKVSSLEDMKSRVITISTKDFFITIPKSLVKVTSLPTPRVGKLVLALQAKEMKNGFINNLIIIKQILKKTLSSKEFSIMNNVWAKNKYINYKKISMQDIVFDDKDKSILYFFEARYNSKTAKNKFLQVGKICNKTQAYILTIGLNPRVYDIEKYVNYLKSFKCKNNS